MNLVRRGLGRSLASGLLSCVLGSAAVVACGGEPSDATDSGGSGGTGGAGAGGSGSAWDTVSCGDRSASGATKVSGVIDEDTTWSGKVYLDGVVTVAAQLTIEPGTEVVAAAYSKLLVSDGGSVLAQGSVSKAVTFCGEGANAGSWGGIFFAANSASSVLSYVLVSDAGSDEVAVLLDGQTLVDHLKVANSGADGVHASTFAVGSQSLTVSDSTGLAVVLTAPAAITPFPVGGEFTDNDDDSVHLRFDAIEEDVTFADLGVPYLQEGDVEILAGEIEFLAGVVYQLAEDVSLEVGTGDETVRFDVRGKEDQPVVFEGREPMPGFFRQIHIGDNVDGDSTIGNATIRFGGKQASSFEVNSAVTINDVLVEDCTLGVVIYEQGLDAASRNLTVRGIEQAAPLELAPDALFTIPNGSEFSGAVVDAIFVMAGVLTKSGTVVDFGVPYHFGTFRPDAPDNSHVEIAVGSTLVISAGVQIWIPGGNQIVVRGQLQAIGTANARIAFGRSLFTDYASIVIDANADADTSFEYADFSGGETCLTLNRPVNVSSSYFTGCTTFGIRANTTTPAYTQGAYEALMPGTTFGVNGESAADDAVYDAF